MDKKHRRPRTFIIAEAGVNHDGSLQRAKELVDAAARAGADAVKFQTFSAEKLVSRAAPKARYQLTSTDPGESQFEMIKRLEFDEAAHRELIDYCQSQSITFLSSPFGLESIDLLEGLGLEIFKIPSGELTNLPYLRKIGGLRKDVIVSTGMATMKEVGDALEVLTSRGTDLKRITVLHCNTEYPTPAEDVNLRAMKAIAETYGVRVGYSDHTLGVEVAIAAVALGAEVIEKHFTLDRNLPGPDHKASLEPHELKNMIQAIRNIELALGSGEKAPSPSEEKNIPIARKSIIAARDIKRGEVFTEENLTVKRPGSGISPMRWDEVMGEKAVKDFTEDDLIVLD